MLAGNWYDVVPPPFLTLAAICVLLALLWLARRQLADLIRTLGLQRVSAFGIDLQFTEATVTEAYDKQKLPAPSPDDRAAIEDAARWLSPLVAQTHVLWVDDVPANNTIERAMLLSWEIEVQTVRSTNEALRELDERRRPTADSSSGTPIPYFDLVISDWSRPADDTTEEPAGLQLLRLMRAKEHQQPVILYHGNVDRENRRVEALSAGATGSTADPGELFCWTLVQLVRTAFDHPTPLQRRRRARYTPAAVREPRAT